MQGGSRWVVTEQQAQQALLPRGHWDVVLRDHVLHSHDWEYWNHHIRTALTACHALVWMLERAFELLLEAAGAQLEIAALLPGLIAWYGCHI